MPFRSIVAPPEELAQISSAFDKAWREIEARGVIPPLSVAAERERLGYIVAGLWKAQSAGDLARMAVEQFFMTGLPLSTTLPNIAHRDDSSS